MRRVDPPPARGVANANRPSRQPQPIPLAGSVAAQRLGASDAPPVRVGVIGLGFGADVHIPALQQLQETALVAVCSLKPEDAHLVAAQHLVPHVTTDARALINHPEVEAVIIATPPSLHHSMAITAIESACAVASPVTRLVTPGPEDASQTPTRPVTRA